jgi:hypothetical protein
MKNRGQGDVPLGLLPPLGERGGHHHNRWGILAKYWRKKDFNRDKKTVSRYLHDAFEFLLEEVKTLLDIFKVLSSR